MAIHKEALAALEVLAAGLSPTGDFTVTWNWESPDRPVDFRSLFRAKEFLLLLPEEHPTPRVLLDPDGHIDLEWTYQSASLILMFLPDREDYHFFYYMEETATAYTLDVPDRPSAFTLLLNIHIANGETPGGRPAPTALPGQIPGLWTILGN